MDGFTFFKVDSTPDKEFDRYFVFDAIGTCKFALLYDFSKKITMLGIDGKNSSSKIQNIMTSVPGLKLSLVNYSSFGVHSTINAYRRHGEKEKQILSDIFDNGIDRGDLVIVFEPIGLKEIAIGKSYLEKLLSKREAGKTSSFLSGVINKRANTAIHSENYVGSEEKLLLTELLDSLNDSVLRSGIAYNIYFLLNDPTGMLTEYINSRFLVFSTTRARMLPLGLSIASTFMNIYGVKEVSHTITTVMQPSSGPLELGTVMKDATFDTTEPIGIDPSSLNLGTIITGLPGSGKTMEAMSIIDGVIKSSPHTKICVVSPSDEWNDFANEYSFYSVKIYDNSIPINFFRCPQKSNVEKFYQDLAMILSSAANAGPYRSPMEKCMLNAFRKIYSKTRNPDPILLYKEIEESIIKFHAKRTNVGTKYTKHGENIKSALENLRAIVSRPEYSVTNGIEIEDILDNGVVFDLSNVSIGMKPYLYALILNQIYSIASLFDNNGDNELRLLLCIEEAQITFRDKQRDNAAVEDLKYRIQDFRKQGIGIMLLAHNVSDIEQSIRRLCQTKIYLKQASDTAQVAAKELVFTYASEEDVAQKLKHLDSRVGAVNYVAKKGNEKLSRDTIFIHTKEHPLQEKYENNNIGNYLTNRKLAATKIINSKIEIEAILSDSERQKEIILEMSKIRLLFLGEEIGTKTIKDGKLPTFEELFQGKEYTLQILDKKNRILHSEEIKADNAINVKIP